MPVKLLSKIQLLEIKMKKILNIDRGFSFERTFFKGERVNGLLCGRLSPSVISCFTSKNLGTILFYLSFLGEGHAAY